jgi:hypothetical protein
MFGYVSTGVCVFRMSSHTSITAAEMVLYISIGPI